MKRRRTNYCFLCEKTNQECDGQRPCNRCTTNGKPHMCLSGSDFLVRHMSPTTVRNVPMQLNSQLALENQRTPQTATIDPNLTSAKIVNITTSVSEPDVNFQEMTDPVEIKPIPETSINPTPFQTTTTINSFLMSELQRLKDDQSKLHSEISSLKTENIRLSSKLDRLLCSNPTYKPDVQKAMVMFDLTKTPAVVLTANDTFCDILGYTMSEVVGSPWQMFVHHEYLKRTLDILTKRSVEEPTVTFEQVYRHKNGAFFATTDTHTIFYSHGSPVSDLVTMVLETPRFPAPEMKPRIGFSPVVDRKPVKIEHMPPSTLTHEEYRWLQQTLGETPSPPPMMAYPPITVKRENDRNFKFSMANPSEDELMQVNIDLPDINSLLNDPEDSSPLAADPTTL